MRAPPDTRVEQLREQLTKAVATAAEAAVSPLLRKINRLDNQVEFLLRSNHTLTVVQMAMMKLLFEAGMDQRDVMAAAAGYEWAVRLDKTMRRLIEAAQLGATIEAAKSAGAAAPAPP